MTKRSIAGACALMFGLVTMTSAAGPELSVGASCDTDRIGGGAAVTVPITFRAGTGDAGLPNGVSAIDFAVTFAADALTVSDVRPSAGLAPGTWTFDWERTLGLPETPGRVGIAIAPEFQFPLPTLPDGPIAELVLTGATTGESRCLAIEIPPDSVVLSTPPLGLAITPGSVTGGGVAVTELCQDCADNDGDGLIDLADPDCGARPISAQVMVKRTKHGVASPSIRGTIATALEELAGPVRLSLRPEGVEPATCFAVEAQVSGRKGKKNRRTYKLSIAGKKVATLVSNLKKSRTTMAGKLSGLALPPDARGLSVSLWLGSDPFHVTIPLKKSSKKGEVYR